MRLQILSSIMVCAAVLSACSVQKSDSSDPYKADMDELVAQAEGIELASSILRDRRITEEEIHELDQAFISCLDEHDFPGATVDKDGGVGVPIPEDERDSTYAYQECQEATLFGAIRSLDFQMRTNPEHLSGDEAVLRCVKRFNAIDPNISVEEFSREEDEWYKTAPRVNDVIHGDPADAHTFTDPVKGPEVFEECTNDPSISPDDH